MPISMAIPDQRRRIRLLTPVGEDETSKDKKEKKLKLDESEEIDDFVQKAYEKVMQRRNAIKSVVLKDYLLKRRDAVLRIATLPKEKLFKRLPTNATPTPDILNNLYCRLCESTNEQISASSTVGDTSEAEATNDTDDIEREHFVMAEMIKPFKVKMSGGGVKSKSWQVKLSPPILLYGTHPPRPHSSATIFLKTHYATEDEQILKHVPYFGDDDKEDVVSDLYDLEDREKQMEFGSEYQERDTNDIIDETLAIMKTQLDDSDLGDETKGRNPLQTRLHERLGQVMDVYVDRIHERYQRPSIKDTNDHISLQAKEDKKPKEIVSYLDAVDTYRNLFCRRCFTYDCNGHGNLEKPSLELQGKSALRKELEGFWNGSQYQGMQALETKSSTGNEEIDVRGVSTEADASGIKRIHDEIATSNVTSLSPTDKALCERAFFVFQGDVDKIAIVLGFPQQIVEEYVLSTNLKWRENETVKEHIENEAKKRKKKKNFEKSMNNYNLAWLKRVEDAEIHPMFIPCDHDGPCSESNCTCIQNAYFCTKHCVGGLKGRNFFRGCACKGRCTTGSCSCFAAKRECDPDLCKACEACTDPPNKPALQQRCRNDNIGMRRHCHLLLGQSIIEDAGWGIYTKQALKKGDFVHEYVGEVISQEEAERRGRIYDKVNRSYLFNLTSDFVVDASRKGNKSRFANHSQKPNCCTKMVVVNGDVRIGLYAKEDIEAQSELFFDYRYDVGMDNDLIIKPGMTVDWMKNSKMAGSISKKYSAA